jgi:hypothetical protein
MAAIDLDHRRQAAPADFPAKQDLQAPQADPLELALAELARISDELPLERRIRRLQGVLALHFDDKDALVRKSFRIERALHPSRVNLVLEQATAWSFADPHETALLWHEAVTRAKRLDTLHPGTQCSAEHTLQRIQQEARADTRLEGLWK